MMEDKSRRNSRQTDDTQRRIASRIALITFALMLVVAIVTLFFTPSESKTPIDNIMMPLVAVSAGYAYFLARRGDHARGVMILLGSIAATATLYPFVADNVGWQAALGMLLIVTGLANTTLPPRRAAFLSGGAFVLAIIIIAVELFVDGITNIPVTTSSLVVTGVLVAVYAGIILLRFRQFALRTKLITAFIAVSIVSVLIVTFAVSRSILAQLTTQIEQEVTGVASLTASSISAELDRQVNLLRVLSLNDVMDDELSEINATAISDPDRLEALDRQWRAADLAGNDNDPLVRSVLDHIMAKELLEFRNNFPEHVEIFVTDQFGANVASTNRTSDYYQADEEWWQAAYNNGLGSVYISDPIFDESSQALALQIALPIRDDTGSGEVIGVLRTTLDLSIFVSVFEQGRFGQTGRTEIYLPDGTELEIEREADGSFDLHIEEAPADFLTALQTDQTFLDTLHDGIPVLVGVAPLAQTTRDNPAIPSLGWRVVSLQDRAEALQIVSDVTRSAQIVGLGVLLLAGLLAVGVAQFLTAPILRLTRAAERVSSGDLQARVSVETADEIGTLADSFNRMTSQIRDILGGLERRVAERTADLEAARLLSEQRAQNLQSISEISRVISSEQNLETLLPLITRLVSERFNFYHVGIFFVDPAGQFAVLQAANSEGGQRMLARGHRLEVGQTGIVGNVADTGKTRIALDVGSDAVFFNNPDLPMTRSEMALPLNVRGRTIGVLDVQSTKPGAFSENDANILSILADQVAIAIENARLFGETQRAREEAETLYNQYLSQEWTAFTRKSSRLGYRQSITGGEPLETPVESEEIRAALQRGEVVVLDAKDGASQPAIALPVKLRGQIIGVMNIRAHTPNRKWNRDEINLVQAVSDRLALALENARLLQESQRRAAKEAKIGEVSAKIGGSINMRSVLQTAVEELGRALPGAEVVIQFQNDKDNGSR